jgi:hypothetical protein
MSGNGNALSCFDSPDVPAQVVLQFADARLHAVSIDTCGHIGNFEPCGVVQLWKMEGGSVDPPSGNLRQTLPAERRDGRARAIRAEIDLAAVRREEVAEM